LVGPRPARLTSVGTEVREVVASVVLTDADNEGMRRSYPCSPALKEACGLQNTDHDHRGSQSSLDFAATGSETCPVDRNERVEDQEDKGKRW
jgi:hypothetical protein